MEKKHRGLGLKRRIKTGPAWLVPGLWLMLSSFGGAAAVSATSLESWDSNAETAPVIVVLKSTEQTKEKAPSSGGWLNLEDYIDQVQTELAGDMGWVNFNELVRYKNVPAVAKSISATEFARLKQSNLVAGIYPDRANQVSLVNSARNIGLPLIAADSPAGSGFSVAIIDSGVEVSHPFLQNRVVDGACFSFNGSCPGGEKRAVGIAAGQPCRGNASCYHGTHVAGIVAGQNAEFSGVAARANLIALNTFSNVGQRVITRDSDIMQALEWVYEHAEERKIAAVNMSLGGGYFTRTCDDSPVKRFIDLLADKGVVTVVASGNDGQTAGVASPACISTAVTVGSTEPDGSISAYSNSYTALDIVAPGGKINSSTLNGQYKVASGTSMATPQVAGAVALLRSGFPDATAAQLIAALSHGKRFTDPRNRLTTTALWLPEAITWLAAQNTTRPAPARPRAPTKPDDTCSDNIDGIIISDDECSPSEQGDIQW